MPKIRDRKKKQQYSSEDLAKASEEYKNGAKISSAARQFGIPYQTLHYKLTKTFSVGK